MRNRALLFFLALLSCTVISAQDIEKLYGKWKVVSLSGPEFYIDLKKDSAAASIPTASAEDSAMVQELLAMMVDSIGNVEFILRKDGAIEKWHNGKLKENGTYTVDGVNKLIIIKTKRDGLEKKEPIKYEFVGPLLKLTELDKGKNLTITLERAKLDYP